MRKVTVQFLDHGFHRVVFDAMPMPVFVVDDDVCILEYNAVAAKLMGKNRRSIIGRRCGEVLDCIHSKETPEGCGHARACLDCVARNSVRSASRGHRVVRQWAKMKLRRNGKYSSVKMRVSCQRFTYKQRSFFLLILEGLND